MTDNELLDKALLLRDVLINNDLEQAISLLEEINNEIINREEQNNNTRISLPGYILEIAIGQYGNKGLDGYAYVIKNLLGIKESYRRKELFKLYNLALLSQQYNVISLEEFLNEFSSDKESFDALSFIEKASVVRMLLARANDDDDMQDKKEEYLERVKQWLKESEEQEEDENNDN